MKLKLLVRKLGLSKERFIVDSTIKSYCKYLNLDYSEAVNYLLRHKYIVRILRGIFYIKSIEERKLNKTEITILSAIKKALEIKKINKWYFGFETALKLNNMTHEYYTMDFLVTDCLFRPKPVKIMGRKVRFIKIKKKMLSFGIIRSEINYSDPEKTILDIAYLEKYKGSDENTIKKKIAEYLPKLSKKKMKNYLKFYPSTIKRIMEGLL